MLWFKGALILHVRWWTAPTPMQMHCLARTANGEPNSQDRFSYLTHEDFIPFWNAEMQMQNGRLVELQPHSVDENEKGWVHQFVLWMWAYIGRPGDHILHHTMFATRDWLQSNKKKIHQGTGTVPNDFRSLNLTLPETIWYYEVSVPWIIFFWTGTNLLPLSWSRVRLHVREFRIGGDLTLPIRLKGVLVWSD